MDNIFRLGSVISRGFKIYFRNFFSFTLLLAIIFSPLMVLTLSLVDADMTEDDINAVVFLLMGGGFFLSIVASAAVTYGTFEQLRGRHATVGASVIVGLKRLLPALLVGFVMLFGIALGFVALIIPGIMFSCMWWVAIPVSVVERPGIFASLSRSRELTKGYRWQVFGAMFLLNMVSSMTSSVLELVFLGKNATVGDIRTYMIGVLVVTTLTAGVTAVVTVVAYHDLRHVKEGIDTDELASVFD